MLDWRSGFEQLLCEHGDVVEAQRLPGHFEEGGTATGNEGQHGIVGPEGFDCIDDRSGCVDAALVWDRVSAAEDGPAATEVAGVRSFDSKNVASFESVT